jgi:hypothetical protein
MECTTNGFVFKNHDEIGAAAAEDDDTYLSTCFVDTGDIEVLKDCSNPKSIIIGRTGAGKSALLNNINHNCKNSIHLSPHDLSLNYIANNEVIAFFEEAGVNLSIFYGLLWKHIFVVELLKNKFDIKNADSQKNYSRHIKQIFYKKDKIKEMAVDYLENWGDKFWETTDQRMIELTTKVESKLSKSLKGKLPNITFGVDAVKNLSEEEKYQVKQLGQKAVSEVQVRELENIISILSTDIFNDPQQQYILTIDMLDEEWVDNKIRFSLIKSLIDTIRRFRKVENVKIIIALRQDLLNKVVYSGRGIGFQEEKYESLYLHLKWNKKQLLDLIEKRISFLIKRRYTKEKVNYKDIFPAKIDGKAFIDYISERTFLRPRDIILFINECISCSTEQKSLTAHNIKTAEETYSFKRLQSLATEWQMIYPSLKDIVQIFYGMEEHFDLSKINEELLLEQYSIIVQDHGHDDIKDPLITLLDKMYSKDGNFNSSRASIIRSIYQTGLIGVKLGPTSSVNWSYSSKVQVSVGQIKASAKIYIHPMFYRALGIKMINR